MRIGEMVGGYETRIGVEGFIERARDLESRGFDTMWIPHVFAHDAIGIATLLARETERIELGTAVVPTQPRHPASLAQQALTAGAASGGRFTLGIGLSHPPVIENMHGLSYARRASHMREYMAVLGPLLRGEAASFEGEEYRVSMAVDVPDAQRVPVLIAALGPRMLEIAGSEAAGTILWMTGFRTIEEHVVPTICAAAEAAGRSSPRIVAGMNVALVSDVEAAQARMAEWIGQYRLMPSYKAMIDREGSDKASDFAIVGDERTLAAGLDRLESIGVTDLDASILDFEEGCRARTLDFLASRAGRGR
ncbi:MAG: TIGR03564 family F420-dependent LLM class oxidoreductase [Deltaproteobacteria bacterium]|nr:TIGR03564 family F420-dependent LLM class oxidoreductase [Deltaproteobacteria bacterium]